MYNMAECSLVSSAGNGSEYVITDREKNRFEYNWRKLASNKLYTPHGPRPGLSMLLVGAGFDPYVITKYFHWSKPSKQLLL